MGGKPDRSGKPGVDQPTIDKFFEEWLPLSPGLTRLSGTPPFGRWAARRPRLRQPWMQFEPRSTTTCPLVALAALTDGGRGACPTESDLAALAGRTLTNDAAETRNSRWPPSEPSVRCCYPMG